jgi:mono/diheme cytochrome c family protein
MSSRRVRTGPTRHRTAALAVLFVGSVLLAGRASAGDDAERGQYLTAIGGCASCHTRPDGEPFVGGRPFATPFGTLYSSNITPDDETGIGTWGPADLRRAMHEGVARDGTRLFPAFPYPSFTRVSDEDINAIYAYLRTLKPLHYRAPANGFLFTQRWPMRIWNALFLETGRFVPDASKADDWNRGAYLVRGLGHCGACHTRRNPFMAEVARDALAGGVLDDEVAPNKPRRWSGVNLTSSRQGLGAWSVEELTQYLHSGFSARGGTFGPMNEVVAHSLRPVAIEDLRAMAVFLKSLPARDAAAVAGPGPDQVNAGARTYQEHCEKCHRASGRGGVFTGPPLAGSAVAQAEDPSSLINVILYGAAAPKEVTSGTWETMKPYFNVLSDAEVAAVANYLRASWGNHAGPVWPADVKKQR